MLILRLIPLLIIIALTSGCASVKGNNPNDPFEPVNRSIYKFNDTLDKAIAKPIAQGYDAVVPLPGKILIGNFFSNLDDVVVTFNDLLQLKFIQATSDATRVVFNSTFGIFGLIEITQRLEKHHEDFGQTLGYWNIGTGPYLMLPILGPSTIRDGLGLFADSKVSLIPRIKHIPTRNQLYVVKAVKRRAEILDQEKVMEGAALDNYAYIRDAYLQYRQNLVYDGHPPRAQYEEYDDYEPDPVPAPVKVPVITIPSSKLELTPNEKYASLDMEAYSSDRQNKIHRVWLAPQKFGTAK